MKRARKGSGSVFQTRFETNKDRVQNAAARAAAERAGEKPPKKILSGLGGWRIKYTWNHKVYNEKVPAKSKREAGEFLKQRFAEIRSGTFVKGSEAESLRYEDMRGFLLRHYEVKGRKSLRTATNGEKFVGNHKHLDEFFRGQLALDVDARLLDKFVIERQRAGAANGTVNRELAALRRMFHLAVKPNKKLRGDQIPEFTLLKEASPRKGFLEPEDFPRLRRELPEHLRATLTLAYYTGMRRGEILTLRWENVDLFDGIILLTDTKNGDQRKVPLNGECLEMLKVERARYPGCPWVFSRDGRRPLGSFRKAWERACARAGLDGLLFHDLRRSGVRNLVRSGVPESVAMAISGHKTRAVFERYNITSDRDLKEAMRKVTDYNSDLMRPAEAEAQTVVQ